MRVERGHRQLADVIEHGHAHAEEDAGAAVVEVEEIVGRSLAFQDLQSETDVQRFFAGAADPKVRFPGLRHFDGALFQSTGADHQAIDFEAAIAWTAVPPLISICSR